MRIGADHVMSVPFVRLMNKVKELAPDDETRKEVEAMVLAAHQESLHDARVIQSQARSISSVSELLQVVLRDGGTTAQRRGTSVACGMAMDTIIELRERLGTYENILRTNELLPAQQLDMFRAQ